MFLSKKTKASAGDVNSRIAAIKALGEPDTSKKKKKKDDEDSRLNQLLSYLKDEDPACRIAAAEALATSSKDIAVTYICRYIQDEKDENVIKAMKESLASIRANIHANR